MGDQLDLNSEINRHFEMSLKNENNVSFDFRDRGFCLTITLMHQYPLSGPNLSVNV